MNSRQRLGLDRCDIKHIYNNDIWSHEDFYKTILYDVKDGNKILDAGAGEGKLKNIFSSKNIEYCGIDFGVGCDSWDYSDVIHGDLEDLHFIDNNEFDSILLIQVLEHLKNPRVVLKELNRVLKNNGKIYIAVPQLQGVHQVPYDYFRFTPYGLSMLLEESGFKVESINPQLYGDMQAASRNFQWAVDYYRDNTTKVTRKVLLFIFNLLNRLIFKLAGVLDKDIDKYLNPIGYFVVARKI